MLPIRNFSMPLNVQNFQVQNRSQRQSYRSHTQRNNLCTPLPRRKIKYRNASIRQLSIDEKQWYCTETKKKPINLNKPETSKTYQTERPRPRNFLPNDSDPIDPDDSDEDHSIQGRDHHFE
jgi:hypothetical protein